MSQGSCVIKSLNRGSQHWTIMHNKWFHKCQEVNRNVLDLIRETPDKDGNIEIDFIEKDFYNVRECLRYIEKWHEENEPLKSKQTRCIDCGDPIPSGTLCPTCHYQTYTVDMETEEK